MKTTIELPDALFREAKVVAARRRITLKRLLTQALRKEIAPAAAETAAGFKVDEDGVPYLAKRGETVRSADIHRLEAESED